MFQSILGNAGTLSISTALVCTGVCILLGMVISVCYYITNRGQASKAFCLSLIILPALVQSVIMLVNGNLGAGVAIVGAFSLIRFRSIPGNSRDISTVFFTMVVGLAAGMGYVTYAVFITIFLGAVMVLTHLLPVGAKADRQQSLIITIYEDLDYTTVFDDLFSQYLTSYDLQEVKTTNMGSMYRCHYVIRQKDKNKEKEFIDALRCRNGNLTIICGKVATPAEQL